MHFASGLLPLPRRVPPERLDARLCALVVIGARPDGTKEVMAVEDGYRESKESWQELLRDLKKRGMRAPRVACAGEKLVFDAIMKRIDQVGPGLALLDGRRGHR
jgi:hypothetical protein